VLWEKPQTDDQSFRRQLEEGLSRELPHVPLPTRQHQPISARAGTAQEDQNGQTNGIKHTEHAEGEAIKEETRDSEIKAERTEEEGVSNGQ